MGWPKLVDGTVDWMTVFQDPRSGLIALMEQSDTSDKLRDCFRYVIDVLFSRDDDAPLRVTYYGILEDTFEGGSDESALNGQKIKIRMVMMRVMNDRIKMAREYVAAKAAKEASADGSRRTEDSQSPAIAV